jgi:hypothetical protein
MRFRVVVAAIMKIAAFRGVTESSLLDKYRHFEGMSRLHHQGSSLKMEAAGCPKKSITLYHTTQCNNPGYGNPVICCMFILPVF